MARSQDETDLSYDDPQLRRKTLLDQMDGPAPSPGVGAAPAPSPAPAPPSGPLPPSAPPPSAPVPTPTGPHGGTPTTGLDPYTSGIQDLYQSLLKRQAGNADFVAQSSNPNGLDGIKSSILASPEYKAMQSAPITAGDPVTPQGAKRPTGGSLSDPNYVQQLIAWAASQPGVNPSVVNDPNYWTTAVSRFNGDENEFVRRMFTAEGAPVGGQQQTIGGFNTSGGLTPEISQYFKTLTDQINAQMAQNQQLMESRRSSLLQLMDQGQKPVDIQNDPTLKAASDAYATRRHRGQAEDRAALAERAAFTGLNSGGQGSGSFDAGVNSLNERANQDISSNDAQLAYSELNQRRSALLQAIQIADAIGARAEGQQLNATLAQIDAAMKQQQLGFNYAQLGQQQGQFEDNTAFNYAQLIQNGNRDALLYGGGA